MLVRGYARTIKTGGPVPDGTEVRIRLHEDNSLIATAMTVGGEYEHNFQGNPGPYWVEVEYAGETHVSSSKVVGMSGATNIGGIPLMFNLWTDGYIPGVLSELAVSSSGVGMSVSVAGGAGICQGVLYDQSAVLPLVISAADSQPRIDTIVLQVVPAFANENTEGRAKIIVKTGTPAATPVAPSLTQTTTLFEMPLADVTVDIGASSIASNKVADRRSQSNAKIGGKYITDAMIADNAIKTRHIDDAAVTGPEIAADAVTNVHIKDGTIVAANIAPGAIETAAIKTGAVTEAKLGAKSVSRSKLADKDITHLQILDGSVITNIIANGAVTEEKLGAKSVSRAKLADKDITHLQILDGAVITNIIANGAVTEEKLASNSVSSSHIKAGTIVDANLSASILDRLSAHGVNWATAPFDFITTNLNSYKNIQSVSLSLGTGEWLLLLWYNGQVSSVTANTYSAVQVRMTGSAASDLIASHAVQNVETHYASEHVTMLRVAKVIHASTATRTLTLQALHTSGAGKVQGFLGLLAIRIS